ncbi:MAG: hypothetical protein V1723_01780 [Candidatus Uhrbacteria bacterium]
MPRPSERRGRQSTVEKEQIKKLIADGRQLQDRRGGFNTLPQRADVKSAPTSDVPEVDERRGGATSPPEGDHVGSPLHSDSIPTSSKPPPSPPMASVSPRPQSERRGGATSPPEGDHVAMTGDHVRSPLHPNEQRARIPVRQPIARANTSTSGRPRIEDIRAVPSRLVGPIEELGRLAIADFRKIAAMPAEAAVRIANKLELLGRDSYTKRAEGIRALRGSSLMRRYADTLNAALVSGKNVDEEVRARSLSDPEALTTDEFQAIAGLNARLRR